ncbi:GNAT family N-acetyltransferase [Nonomuraea sp. SBT364]|uniref:GNAT family N-acetyltransferase n=1 Tax=Nonomuraea sp. SBT364 TaxID=1580530 RepID=UPI00066B9E82|nr:GNAT family protein [Nonomuraea sp. SBT364]
MLVPELTAESGFLVRPWRLDDLAAIAEAATDPYIPLITSVPSEYSDAEGVAFVRRQWARAADGAGYSFAIARDGRAVGQIGLWPGPHGRASVGYWVVGSARGQGVARAALRAVSPWALGQLRIARLEAHVEPWNVASWKAAERAGFAREGLLRQWQEVGGERRDMYLYARLGG